MKFRIFFSGPEQTKEGAEHAPVSISTSDCVAKFNVVRDASCANPPDPTDDARRRS